MRINMDSERGDMLNEIDRLRAERDRLIAMLIHPGYRRPDPLDGRDEEKGWVWNLGDHGSGFVKTGRDAIAAVREAAGLPREDE